MPLLRDADRENLRKELNQLQNPVRLVFFTQALNCEYCGLTKQVLEEVVGLSNKIELKEYNFAIDRDAVAQYRIARVPAIAVTRLEPPRLLIAGAEQKPYERDYGIRYYGVPAGYEFAALIGDILDVSAGESGLTEQTKQALRQLTAPLHLQVFTTPTCPHCPRAVRLAHKMAMESELITADAVDASEYPDLAERYQIYGVPLTVANERLRLEGGMPEAMFVQKILQGVSKN